MSHAILDKGCLKIAPLIYKVGIFSLRFIKNKVKSVFSSQILKKKRCVSLFQSILKHQDKITLEGISV